MKIKLTEKDLKVLDIISAQTKFIGPTEIGVRLGKSYNTASSYCSNSLKKLVSLGRIINIEGKYSILK